MLTLAGYDQSQDINDDIKSMNDKIKRALAAVDAKLSCNEANVQSSVSPNLHAGFQSVNNQTESVSKTLLASTEFGHASNSSSSSSSDLHANEPDNLLAYVQSPNNQNESECDTNLATTEFENASDSSSSSSANQRDVDKFPKLVIGAFRRIIKRFKDGIPASQFFSEYYKDVGYEMDAQSWGYNSPIEVFYALPSVFLITPPDISNEVLFPGAESDHILYDATNPPSDVLLACLSDDSVGNEFITNKGVPRCRKSIKTKLKPVDEKVLLRVLKLLLAVQEHGIAIPDFATIYELNYRESLNIAVWNYSTMYDFFVDISRQVPLHVVLLDDLPTAFIHEPLYKDWLRNRITENDYAAVRMLIDIPENVVLPDHVIPPVTIPEDYFYDSSSKTSKWIPILIASAMNPDMIWILLQSECVPSLDILMEQLTFYEKPEAKRYTVPKELIVKGLICAARFLQTETWHRVQVTRTPTNKSQVTVAYIDYGGVASVEAKGLRLLKQEWAYLPAQAVRVALKGIRPIDKTERRIWRLSTREHLLEYSKEDYWLACLFCSKLGPNKYIVEICDTNNPDQDVFLSELLVKLNLAEFHDETESNEQSDSRIPAKTNGLTNETNQSLKTSNHTAQDTSKKSRGKALKEFCRSVSQLGKESPTPSTSGAAAAVVSPPSSSSMTAESPKRVATFAAKNKPRAQWKFSASIPEKEVDRNLGKTKEHLQNIQYKAVEIYNGEPSIFHLGSVDIRKVTKGSKTRRVHLLAVGAHFYVFAEDVGELLKDYPTWQQIAPFGISVNQVVLTDGHEKLLSQFGLHSYIKDVVVLYPLRSVLELCETLRYFIPSTAFRTFFKLYSEKHKRSEDPNQVAFLRTIQRYKLC